MSSGFIRDAAGWVPPSGRNLLHTLMASTKPHCPQRFLQVRGDGLAHDPIAVISQVYLIRERLRRVILIIQFFGGSSSFRGSIKNSR